MSNLTLEQEACNYHTFRHIEKVRNYLSKMCCILLKRSEKHDQSKMASPEVELFTEMTPILKDLTYGSPEYEESKARLGEALTHHYANNRHHPEHFKNGIEDMNLIDLLEMLCDWKASSERHSDGNIRKSIETNGPRFNMSPQLIRIFENTVDLFTDDN